MKIGLKHAVSLIAPIVASVGCVAVASSSGEKWFNQEEFVGLEDLSSSYEAVSLAYDLDGQDGELISFSSCKDVDGVEESDVFQSQFPLYKKLYANCMGAKYFHSGFVAEEDYFPDDFDQKLVNQLPASIVPNRGGNSLEAESGQVLAKRKAVELVETADKQFTLKVGTTEIDYVLLAEVDTDKDGFQDWVLRLDWSQTDSFGEGTDLIVLTKKSRGGEIEVVSRYP